MKLNKKKTIIFLISVIAVAGIVITALPLIQAFMDPQSQTTVINASYGAFPLCIYNGVGVMGHLENVTGIMLQINNENDKYLNISCIENSSFVTHVNYVYLKQQVVDKNGNIVDGYIEEKDIFIGVETVVVPVKLSPGNYTVVFSDGNYFDVNIS
ncbi:hypothetical protein [Sulfuracidifex metallicus]|uniref:Uncharacterized protein n=2 Tax=Sulfuracidifex metallicus TaxID=47303 RepID=A0A6A9QGT1_SULME|nr:hypothetical protein [Sulfuracidifex metallicus]ABG91830.1 FoxI [Sulfuracidifex metallicus DSM 6482 = JCM 9184]MUN27894.1 hypothetical protein [Sulfuracidifex metallicus DSM 6482 = JCM 9184]